MPSIADGEFLIRNLWLSCDPAQRPWMEVDTYIPKLPLGEVMLSGSAGEVVESKHPDFAPGELVSGVFGWQDYAVSDGSAGIFPVTKVPPGVDLPTAMSLLGVTGLTAHIGLLEIGQPQPGDTVAVSGAAGSVGSFVVQIAKLNGFKVVAIAGGATKCDWLTGELSADAAIDYKGERRGSHRRALSGRRGCVLRQRRRRDPRCRARPHRDRLSHRPLRVDLRVQRLRAAGPESATTTG